MPPRTDVAEMFRADVADARQDWLKAAKQDAKEYLRRGESDFLGEKNHEGEFLDFHSLRHTCGAWLAMAGAHPKAVQSVMRHSTIVLTMDTYGHLFPGQDAATVARLPNMLASEPKALRATGTDGAAALRLPMKSGGSDPGSAQKAQRMRSSQGAIWCWTMRRGATKGGRPQETAQALTLYELRACATQCETVRSGGQGIRTLNRLPGT